MAKVWAFFTSFMGCRSATAWINNPASEGNPLSIDQSWYCLPGGGGGRDSIEVSDAPQRIPVYRNFCLRGDVEAFERHRQGMRVSGKSDLRDRFLGTVSQLKLILF